MRHLRPLRAAVSLHFAHYNLCRVHQTLRVTPAMEAGIENHVWSLEELVTVALEAPEPEPEPLALPPMGRGVLPGQLGLPGVL